MRTLPRVRNYSPSLQYISRREEKVIVLARAKKAGLFPRKKKHLECRKNAQKLKFGGLQNGFRVTLICSVKFSQKSLGMSKESGILKKIRQSFQINNFLNFSKYSSFFSLNKLLLIGISPKINWKKCKRKPHNTFLANKNVLNSFSENYQKRHHFALNAPKDLFSYYKTLFFIFPHPH